MGPIEEGQHLNVQIVGGSKEVDLATNSGLHLILGLETRKVGQYPIRKQMYIYCIIKFYLV